MESRCGPGLGDAYPLPGKRTKGDTALFKKGDELIVEVGTLRRHIGMPRSMATLIPARARLENRILTVEMKEAQ